MKRCPISYQPCGDNKYSRYGLSQLSPKLTFLEDLPFTAREQRMEAAARAAKMSIQGVQAKLSAKLSVHKSTFEIVDKGGTFIIKPQSDVYFQLPENEDLSMKLGKLVGIEVPQTGLIYSKDGSLSYFIKRFDRYGRNKKRHQEDFAQLTGNTRNTKYSWSMEKLVPVIEEYCTFPMLEKLKLFRRVIFCFITGNEDMHLKNFSLISRNNKVELSPAYDLINTTIAIPNVSEEFALPLQGKKRKIDRDLLVDYYGKERLELNHKVINLELEKFAHLKKGIQKLIHISFLSQNLKKKYTHLVQVRFQRMKL
jgi:serine/threonine-protein kinase HipA